MRKKWIVPVLVMISVLGFASLWFFSGPKQTTERWLKCKGKDDKSLVSRSDQEYWEESRIQKRTMVDAFIDACLGVRTFLKTDLSGLTAVVTYRSRMPDLSFEEMVEFPALATPEEKVNIIRGRALNTKDFTENTVKVNLIFEDFHWVVWLDLKNKVQLQGKLKEAGDYSAKGEYKSALEIFDTILRNKNLDESQLKDVKEKRLDTLSEYTCILAAQKYIKYPESADYDIFSLASIAKDNVVSVMGDIMIPNGFGIKSKIDTSCEVTFALDKPTASVKLRMMDFNDMESINISEDAVSVSVAF
jgi:hypothetical protein